MTIREKSTEQVALGALSTRPELTAAEIAAATKRGRSSASKALLTHECRGKVVRVARGTAPIDRWRDWGTQPMPFSTRARPASGAAVCPHGNRGHPRRRFSDVGVFAALGRRSATRAPGSC